MYLADLADVLDADSGSGSGSGGFASEGDDAARERLADAVPPPGSPRRAGGDGDEGAKAQFSPSRGALQARAGRSMRDVMVDAVKSLETEQIRDQKRIRFVDDIYDASMAEDGDFLSPLRRKNDPEMDRLRAQRKGPRAGDERARDGGDSSPRDGSVNRITLTRGASGSAAVSARALSYIEGNEEKDEFGRGGASPGDVHLAPEGGSDAGAEAPDFAKGEGASARSESGKSAALHSEVDDVWVEAIRLARLRVWLFLDDPESSAWAYATSLGILVLILISSVTFCLETMHSFEGPPHEQAFWVIECLCITAFTAEYVMKLLCCPDAKKFVVQPLNLVDLISIVPFYVELLLSTGGGGNARIFRTIRLVRVFRVIKLGSRSGKLQVVTNTMHESLDMLAMMFFLLSLTVLVFATLIFFAERGTYRSDLGIYSRKLDIECDEGALAGNQLLLEDGTLVPGCTRISSPYKSIPDSFWWTMVTLMTVGYGDEVPITGAGRFVACLAMLASVLLMALPISVIGAEFTQQWMEYKKQTSEGSTGKARAAAPKFLELGASLKAHLAIVDETLRKLRDGQSDVDERAMKVRQMIQAREKERKALQRKALTKGKAAVSAYVQGGGRNNGEQEERRLQAEVEALLEDRERLRATAETAELMVSRQFPATIEASLEKYALIQELREDDYEMITAELDDLHFRALEFYTANAPGTPRRTSKDGELGEGEPGDGGDDGGGGHARGEPKTPARHGGGSDDQPFSPLSVGPQL